VSNTRKTVQRRYAKQRELPTHNLASPDRRGQIDDKMDIEALARYLPPNQKEVFLRRAQGQGDQHIAEALHLQLKHIPVLAHRAIMRLRSRLTKTHMKEPQLSPAVYLASG